MDIQIAKPEELEEKLKQAFSIKNKLVFVDVNVDANEHVYPIQGAARTFDGYFPCANCGRHHEVLHYPTHQHQRQTGRLCKHAKEEAVLIEIVRSDLVSLPRGKKGYL